MSVNLHLDENRDAAQPIAGMAAQAESSEKVEYVAVETNRPAPHLQAAASAASNNEFGGAAPGKPSSSSPFNSSNSGKGSITSTSNLGSTFKSSTSSTNGEWMCHFLVPPPPPPPPPNSRMH